MAKIIVQEKEITILTVENEDYISLTDMLKAKDGDFLFQIGLEIEILLNILEFGRRFITQILIMANSP